MKTKNETKNDKLKEEEIASSQWSLKISFSKKSLYALCLLIHMESEPVPDEADFEDPHPYTKLFDASYIRRGDSIHEEVRKTGIYEEYIADNSVTRALIEILENSRRINLASGNTDWRWYRMKLVQLIDMLWD